MGFSGTQSLKSANTFGSNITQPNTYSAVTKFTGTACFCSYYAQDVLGSNFLGHTNSANTWRIDAGADLNGTASDASFHAMQGLMNGASGNFYIDGSANTGSTGTDAISSTGKLIIGGDSFGVNWIGNGAEAGVWHSDISSSMSALNSNQHTFWGF
jgi:hypothetical protein